MADATTGPPPRGDDGDAVSPGVANVLVHQLNRVLRHPSAEISIIVMLNALADDADWWDAQRAELARRGAYTDIGVQGAAGQLLPPNPGHHLDAAASVYAELAHRHGWLALDRELTAQQYADMRDAIPSWCAHHRTLSHLHDRFGPPSIRCTTDDPLAAQTLVYATADPADPPICVHCWDDPEMRWLEPVVLAMRCGGATFEAGFTFTPDGEHLRAPRG